MASPNALNPDHVLELAIKALRDEQPSLKTQYEAVALIGHACMAAVDFRLVGLGEDHNIGLSIITMPSCSFQTTANLNRYLNRESHPPRRMEH